MFANEGIFLLPRSASPRRVSLTFGAGNATPSGSKKIKPVSRNFLTVPSQLAEIILCQVLFVFFAHGREGG